MKIFCSIASYQDPLLPYTIDSILENAKYKDNLVLGVFDQSKQKLEDLPKQVRYKTCEPEESRGACWARRTIQTDLFEGEDIFMQIDSHTQFDKDWDADLLEKYNTCFNWFSKPLISGYPRGFDVITSQGGFFNTKEKLILRCSYQRTDETHVMVFDKGIDGTGGELHCTAKDIPKPSAYYNGYAISGGFIFTEGEWVNKVPYDSKIYFTGEEPTLAIRSFTHGYDIVHVPNTPLFHWYNTDTIELKRDLHWNNDEHAVKAFTTDGTKRSIEVLLGKVKDEYGFGDVRTPAQYAKLSGIDYVNKTVQLDAARGDKMFPYNEPDAFE